MRNAYGRQEINLITYFTLDVVEGEHAVGVSALSLDCSATLAGSGRAEPGTHDPDRPAEASCRRSRDAVPVPGIHRIVRRVSPCFFLNFCLPNFARSSSKRIFTRHTYLYFPFLSFSRFFLFFRLLLRDTYSLSVTRHTLLFLYILYFSPLPLALFLTVFFSSLRFTSPRYRHDTRGATYTSPPMISLHRGSRGIVAVHAALAHNNAPRPSRARASRGPGARRSRGDRISLAFAYVHERLGTAHSRQTCPRDVRKSRAARTSSSGP